MDEIDRSTFKQETSGPGSPRLAQAALLFAREIAYPSLRPSIWLARLDDWASLALPLCPPDGTALDRAQRLAEFLFGEIGLRGNTEAYYDPRNSLLNEVIARGVGLPISLSVIFIEVADRLGFPVEGVGLLGHFVVAVHSEGARYLLDPFHHGALIEDEDLEDLLARATGYVRPVQPEWLQPVAPAAILTRMLFNLREAYVRLEDWPASLATVEQLRILQPESVELVRDLGILQYRKGSLRLASSYLQEYLSRRPDAADAGQVRLTLDALLAQIARLN